MIYEPDYELKKLKREAGLNDRDFANLLQKTPGTIGRMLNGFTVMGGMERVRMMKLCYDKIAEARGVVVDGKQLSGDLQ